MLRRVGPLLVLLLTAACFGGDRAAWLGPPRAIAPGVDYFQTIDPTLVASEGPISVHLLRVDPDRAALASVLGRDTVMGAERVDSMAARRQAIAAVNAGFFNVKNGEPAGLLKIAGELVSDAGLTRGVVAIHSPDDGRQQFFFDQVGVRVMASFRTSVTPTDVQEVQIDGVGTTRERGRLMLYTPAYAADTETAANGTEWVIAGDPPVVTQIRRDLGRTPIPRDGAVLSYGGLDPPSPLDWLLTGTIVRFRRVWRVVHDTPEERFEEARDIVNGAGLLKRDGETMTNWLEVENLQADTFTDVRHPRTIVGVDGRGYVWLAAIDGRQADHSIGMTFTELVALADRLGLVDALNLDGGGSTTMVLEGKIVNRPSDATGPRPVSDAIIVLPRPGT